MNNEDRRISSVERSASPERFLTKIEEVEPVHTSLRRHASGDSSSISTQHMSRFPTQKDEELYRHNTALSRIATVRSQHSHTVGSTLRSRTRQSMPLPAFGDGKPYPPHLPDQEDYVVGFDGVDDPLHAQNWPLRKKLVITMILGWVTLTAAFGSSIFSAATQVVAREFGVSTEVGILGVSLYVLGFATGPLLWAPLSELYGRRMPLIVSSFGFSIFVIGAAVGKDLQTIIICRFFSGFFGASPLTLVAAVFTDLYSTAARGLAVAAFSALVFASPLLAPSVGGFITASYLTWRWTQYLVAIMGFSGLVLELFFLEETYPPILLVNKAAELRRRTKNWGIHAKQEEVEIDLRELLEKNLSRPLRLLFLEPIVLSLSIYMAFVYGILYLLLSFYPIAFQQIRGWNAGVGGLPFIGMIIGELFAAVYMIILQPGYVKKLNANKGIPIPEWRLPPVIVGGVVFTCGLFIFAWTSYKASIPWIAPTLGGLLIGFGLMIIFLMCLNYLIDAYSMFAASAIAASTVLRSLFGAAFPLFSTQMVTGLGGIQYAGTLLGCIALLLIAMPVIFYKFGARIRQKSKFAPTYSGVDQDQASDKMETV